MARKTKPSSPEDARRKLADMRRKDFEAVNLPPEISDLIRNADIEVTRAGQKRADQKVQEDSARRLDAFAALKAGMQAGCFDAARRYEENLMVRRGENDRGPASERVDRTAGFTTDLMILAAEWLEAINARLPPRDWWLLMELLSPTRDLDGWCKVWRDKDDVTHSVGPFFGWRASVAYITGETHDHAQGAAVRSMTVNLRDAIEAHEKAKASEKRAA